MPYQPNIDKKRANQVIVEHVMNNPWKGSTWDQLVHDLIEPLGLTDAIGTDVPRFCSTAASNIRSYFPDSWNNRPLWESRCGPWTRQDGMMKIIEIVRKTARDFIP